MNTISDYIDTLNEKMNTFDFSHERIMIQMRFMSEIERLMDENGINEKELAKRCTISASYLTQLFKGHKKLNLDTIAKFQNAFNVKFKIEAKNIENFYIDNNDRYETLRSLKIVDYKPSESNNLQIAV